MSTPMLREELLAQLALLPLEDHARFLDEARERLDATRPDRAKAAVARLRDGIPPLAFVIPKACWLTSNRQTDNRGYKQRLVNDLQQIAYLAARNRSPIKGRVAAHWTVRYPKGVRKDKGEASNAQPTTKALLDGLVKAGLLEDDGPAWVIAETFTRGPNLDRASDHEIQLVLMPQEVPW